MESRGIVSMTVKSQLRAAAGAFVGVCLFGLPAVATETTVPQQDELQQLRELVSRQMKALEEQQKQLESQRLHLEELQNQVNTMNQPAVRPVGYGVRPPVLCLPGESALSKECQAQPAGHGQTQQAQATPAEGEAPAEGTEKEERPEAVILTEAGGVLTPRGMAVLETKGDYAKSTSNRLNFRGISIIEGFLIGVIEASDADRDTFTVSETLRYGISNRFEAEVEVPYVHREDRLTQRFATSNQTRVNQRFTGDGLGDVEGAIHYQVNDGREGWPYIVPNVRFKSTTGTGPFDVSRDSAGQPTELATGSGSYAVEPSVTLLYPSDPAVLFTNIGYLYNFPDDANTIIGGARIGRVDPGDSIRLSTGIGLALNERLSLSLGYSYDYVLATTTEINGVDQESAPISVAAFNFGTSYKISDSVSITTVTSIGATEDAPDTRVVVRVPYRFNVTSR